MRCKFLSMLVVIFLALPASAHIFRLHSNETSYEPGDEILITLEVKNTLSVEKKFDIHVTLTEEEGKYPPMAKAYSINLSPNEEINLTIYNSSVSEFLSNGNYTVHAQLIEDGIALYEDYLYFSISGLPDTFNIYLISSDRENLSVKKDVFLVGEKVHLGYYSSVGNLSLNCTLIYPDNKTKNIQLPFSFYPDKKGLYCLEVHAEKEGYKSVDTSLSFAVIGGVLSLRGEERREGIPLHLVIVLVFLVLIVIVAYLAIRRKA